VDRKSFDSAIASRHCRPAHSSLSHGSSYSLYHPSASSAMNACQYITSLKLSHPSFSIIPTPLICQTPIQPLLPNHHIQTHTATMPSYNSNSYFNNPSPNNRNGNSNSGSGYAPRGQQIQGGETNAGSRCSKCREPLIGANLGTGGVSLICEGCGPRGRL
jgi:hypothetical protein